MSLLVWLPLNGNLDNWGSSPAKFSLVGSGIATASTGKTCSGSYQRTTANTGGYITSDINFTMSGDMTLACWCKVTAVGSAGTANGIITQHGHQTGGLGITMKDIGSSDFRMSINSGAYGDSHGSSSDRTYATHYGNTNIYNAWHHLCVTYTASTKQIRMYVDGKLDGNPIPVTGNNATARPLRLFDWSTDYSTQGSYKPPCYLNDVRMYDHALSAKEVKLLSQGLVAHYKFDLGGNTNLLPGSWDFSGSGYDGVVSYDNTKGVYKKSYTHPASSSYHDFCQWGSVVSVNANEVYTASFLARSDNSTNNLNVYFYNNDSSGVQVSKMTSCQNSGTSTDGSCRLQLTSEWKRYWITWQFNGTAKALNKTLLFRILQNGGHVELAQVKLEKGPKATPYGLHISETNCAITDDCSGWGNHCASSGTFVNTSDTGRNSASIQVSSTSYMTNTRGMDGNNATISLWIKATSYPTSNAIVFADHNTKIAFGFYGASNLIIACGSDANATRTVSNLSAKWTAADWHHVAIVKSGSTYTFYLDGTEWSALGGSYGANNYWTHTPTNQLLISGRHNGSSREYPFNGQIADFRVYCSSLNAADIQFLAKSVGSATKQGGLLAYEIAESIGTNAKIHKNGIFIADGFSERGLLSDAALTMLPDGSCWARIFHHKNHGGTVLFTSYNEIMNTNTYNKYSKLFLLPYLKATDGKYEFMLTYPEKHPGQYNRWKQSYAPQDTWMGNADGNTVVVGYEAIHIDWTSSYWGGLGRQHEGTQTISNTFIDGSIGHSNWFYAIGATGSHDGGIPGPSSGVQETELWVRIDTLPQNTKLSIMKNQSVSSTLLQEI